MGRAAAALDPTVMGWKERDCISASTGRPCSTPPATRADRLVERAHRRWLVGAKRREIPFRLLEDVGADAEAAVEAEADG